MDPLTGKEAATRVSGMISPKHQVHGYGVNLTVRGIYEVDPVGAVDFGGSEYKRAGKMPVGTRRRTPEDRYEWWDLSRGSYFVEFNETLELAPDELGLIEPDERLLHAGAAHTPQFLRGRVNPVEALLHVDTVRVQIKMNARISMLRLFRFQTSAAAMPPLPPAPKKPAKARSKRK